MRWVPVPRVDYNARLYDPSLGRFLSVDPLIGHPGSTQGINPYSYVANNPLNKTDPTGECADLLVCDRVKGSQGSWFGPREVKDAVNKAEKHGLSKRVGNFLEKAYHGGAHIGPIASNATGNTNVNDGTSLGNTKGHNAAGGDNLDTVMKNWLGKAHSDMVHVSMDGDTTTINISGKVAGGKGAFKTLNDAVNKFWNGVTFKWNGQTVLINTHLTYIGEVNPLSFKQNYDFTVEPEFSRTSNSELGHMDGPSLTHMLLDRGIGITGRERLEAAAHEFGHVLGFGEAYKAVGGGYGKDLPGFGHDIMGVGSPGGGNRVQAWDAEALLREYQP